MKKILDIDVFLEEAKFFADIESQNDDPALYFITDGKAIGTYFEHKFNDFLNIKYDYHRGSSASGIDFPDLEIDMKVTSIKQPQSSCPFTSARQKIYGLGYHLLVFVYEKINDDTKKTSRLKINHIIFVKKEKTADFQTTLGMRQIITNDGNSDDLIAFMRDRNLPIDDIEANNLAEELLKNPPEQGFLTISNALQWRLQYSRIIQKAGEIEGILKIK